MKKYQLILKEEDVCFEKEEKEAKKYASYLETRNGFICNEGYFRNIKEYYFNTLKEMNKFLEENELEKIYMTENGLSNNVARLYIISKLNDDYDYIQFDEKYTEYKENELC